VPELYYVQANDTQGQDWPAPELLLATEDHLIFSAMEEINGYPAIAYAVTPFGGEEERGSDIYYTIKY